MLRTAPACRRGPCKLGPGRRLDFGIVWRRRRPPVAIVFVPQVTGDEDRAVVSREGVAELPVLVGSERLDEKRHVVE